MTHWIAAAGVILAMALGGAGAQAQTVRHIPGKPVLALGTYDLGKLNYAVDEYFLSGEAASYRPVGALGFDGKWAVEAAGKAPFTTRMVVVRPADPAKFNGTVLVEWLNVSAGADGGPDWNYLHRELMRSGYAYVGVSAQKVGVEGGGGPSFPGTAPLKAADPARYGTLAHPGDAYAYDIFTQAARAIRAGKVLGPLKAQRLIGDGESQSAAYLTTYVNAIDPLSKAFDGYLVHSRFGGAARFEEGYLRSLQTTKPEPVQFRSDLRVPVMTVQSETDVMIPMAGYLTARQPDTDKLRVWEVAGTAHADTYTLAASAIDSGSAPIEDLAKAFTPTADLMGAPLGKPMNAAPQHHYVMQAALASLDRWIRGKGRPAKGAVLESAGAPPALVLDANGNAKGGVRSPWVDAPTARLSGLGQTGPGFAALFGTTEPFDQAKLAQLYPGGKADYLTKFGASLDRAIRQGFILKSDEAEIKALAAAMYPVP